MTSGAETDCSAHSSGPARRTADVAAAADGDDRHGHDAAFDGVRKRRSDPRKCATRPHSDRAPAEVRRRAGSTDRRPVWSRWAFRRSPGHARFERCTRYVIFRPKRPSEAPGNGRNSAETAPGSPRIPSKPPRNAPEVAAGQGGRGPGVRGQGVRGPGPPLRAHVPQALQSMRWRGGSARVRCSL